MVRVEAEVSDDQPGRLRMKVKVKMKVKR